MLIGKYRTHCQVGAKSFNKVINLYLPKCMGVNDE
jgi:hypothetical protein